MKGVENYPMAMACDLAWYIVHDPEQDDWELLNLEDVTAEDFDKLEYNALYAELQSRFDINVIKWVARVHDQLGHPSPTALATALSEMGCDDIFVQCARMFVCEPCLKRRRPKSLRVAALPKATYFNEVVDADTFYVMWKKQEEAHLHDHGREFPLRGRRSGEE